MRLIIISGQTSTGKSTIARQLRERLQVESFLKDEYKELLMDADPSLNPLAWMKFERQTWRALYQAVDGSVQTDTDLIIEGNFSSAQRRKIAPLVAGQTVIEIFCYAKPAVVFKRYVARNKNGERHKGHHDNLWYGLVWLEGICGRLGWHWIKPLQLGPRLYKLDTTDFSTVRLNALQSFITSASARAG